jgi:hypothetical protein
MYSIPEPFPEHVLYHIKNYIIIQLVKYIQAVWGILCVKKADK